MKKNFYIIFLCFIAGKSFSQETKVRNNPEYDDKLIHFGYTLGLNEMEFSFGRNYKANPNDTLYADLVKPMLGFHVGMISDLRLGEYFDLRLQPSYNFSQRNLVFFVNRKLNTQMNLESSMIDIPLSLKYKAKRINNYRPYLLGGGSVRYDLAAKKKFDESTNEYVLLRPFDIYYEIGFGIDFYLTYFKFSTEIKLSVGTLNILNHSKSPSQPEYVNALTKLNSNIILFSMHFE